MNKVKNIWFIESVKLENVSYFTGLMIELEDGTVLTNHSTDVVQAWNKVKNVPDTIKSIIEDKK